MDIYLTRNGQQNGPYSADDLNNMLESETITGDDLCWYEGCETWIPLSTFPGFAQPAAAVPPPPPPAMARPPTALPPASNSMSDLRTHPLGYIMLAVAAVGAVLIWRAEPNTGTGFALAAIWISAILGGAEAKQLGIGGDADRTAKGKKKSGPWGWGAFILLLWVVGFPAYLYRRSRYGARNLLLPAAVVSLLFLAAPFLASPVLPAVDAPEVIAIAQRAIEESPAFKLAGSLVGPISISDVGEVSYDRAKQKRIARGIFKTKFGSETIFYSVEWQNRSKGIIWVQIQNQGLIQPGGIPTGFQAEAQTATSIAASAPSPATQEDDVKLERCLTNAKLIGMACKISAGDNDGPFPKDLETLVPDYLPERAILSSPLAPKPGQIDYDYFGAGSKMTDSAAKILLRGRYTTKDGRRSVVHFDGTAGAER